VFQNKKSMALDCRQKQTEALKLMLNLNEPCSINEVREPVWKVLVYDRFGQDIISPLLTIKELREFGVTLHLQLHSDRDAISEVPAIYFVFPTDENIQRICQDMKNNLYEAYYFNFISAISRRKLEDLAACSLHFNCVSHISKVYDQYLGFVSLEDDFFTIEHHNKDSISYYALNRSDAKDADIEEVQNALVESLFSFLVTLGAIPVIRCPKGNAAELVAEGLDKKIRQNLQDRKSLFMADVQSGSLSVHRPVMIILDRNIDLCTPLHHTWTYQALCHDIFGLKLNRITFSESISKSDSLQNRVGNKEKTYDLSSTDRFWSQHKVSPFPTVAESIQKELDEYRASEEEVKRLRLAMGITSEEEELMENYWTDSTAMLSSAVSSLPELLERKQLIDMHTNIATALLEHIKERKLDLFFELEEKIMCKSLMDRSILEVIQDPEAGTPDDKLRLFIIFYISSSNMPTDEFDCYVSALTAAGCDSSNLAALRYIRRWKAFAKVASGPIQTGSGQSTYSAMFSRIMSTGSQFVMEGVKNLVIGTKNLPVTRIVDAIMEHKSNQDIDDYRYFDPKMLRPPDDNSSLRSRSPFDEAIVFIVGGGNYIEYANLRNFQNRHSSSPRKIIYGCSELLNASEFLKQLSQLGEE